MEVFDSLNDERNLSVFSDLCQQVQNEQSIEGVVAICEGCDNREWIAKIYEFFQTGLMSERFISNMEDYERCEAMIEKIMSAINLMDSIAPNFTTILKFAISFFGRYTFTLGEGGGEGGSEALEPSGKSDSRERATVMVMRGMTPIMMSKMDEIFTSNLPIKIHVDEDGIPVGFVFEEDCKEVAKNLFTHLEYHGVFELSRTPVVGPSRGEVSDLSLLTLLQSLDNYPPTTTGDVSVGVEDRHGQNEFPFK